MINYLDLVENYPRDPEMTQFEKVLAAAKRAKSLHNEDLVPYVHEYQTAGYTAIGEINTGLVKVIYKEEVDAPQIDLEDDGEEEE